ncbi:cellulose synthase/poly-beta-1,6-N-acetylglucosamine synthase-like glycosyltransferase [Methylohalomonas lacus]|uniref:Cellulose synthase/poly-beta-1,6-N-acetylglucosamine synthase-like glycosyltransferase n=1 Tax=Methylohalomonas lacus TaxID=398773 RepID=A0AAE3HL25_9GAMM|nr:glycosyltransferase family 2 protein [Methylohalomonas lacus]MCS3904320.1 cellulose synthase/poly-beta-1,6-N-acetylglucosamine synthase-like glycosyltransferase [Methylohalomonas lacus]
MFIIENLFLFCLILVLYIYAGYPACAALLARMAPRPVRTAEYEPFVTVIISAFNEEAYIAETIENKLQQDYPADKLELIVISDGSTDRTDEIVQGFAGGSVRFLLQQPRQGKTAAVNRAVEQARGEIIVFSDANSIYQQDAIRQLLQNFSDPRVGYVTGKMMYVHMDGSLIGTGCSAYMRYENTVRRQESSFGSIVGVDGGIDAMRKSLYRPMNPDQLPDFVQPLTVVEQGFRVIYEPRAVLKETACADQASEYRMRVRVSLRALWALLDKRHLLNPLAYPLFSWQLLSHKLLRYGAWLPLSVLLILNPVLARGSWFYTILLCMQVLFYLSAYTGYRLQRQGRRAPFVFSAPYYFILINLAAARAAVQFLKGHKQVLWIPRTG